VISEQRGKTALERINGVLIQYPRFAHLLEAMSESLAMSLVTDEPQCVALEGDTGAGKSTLLRTHVRRYPRRETLEVSIIPVLYMLTPSPATVGSVLDAMLDALADPGAARGTISAKNSRLVKLVAVCQVQQIILDDFHNLIDSETDHVLATVSDWLKYIIKKTGKPVVVVGIKGKVQTILRSNPELSRLFARREVLEGFAWNLDDSRTTDAFGRFWSMLETAAEMPLVPSLPRLEFLARVHYATNGIVGNMMNLTRTTVSRAEKQGSKILELEHFSTAFQERLEEHLVGKVNPFLVDPNEMFEPPSEPPLSVDPAESTGRRSKARKERKPSVKEVLKRK